MASVPGFAANFLISMLVDAHAARLGSLEFVSEPGRYEPVAAEGGETAAATSFASQKIYTFLLLCCCFAAAVLLQPGTQQ